MNKRILLHHPDPWKNGTGFTFVWFTPMDGKLTKKRKQYYIDNGWIITYEKINMGKLFNKKVKEVTEQPLTPKDCCESPCSDCCCEKAPRLWDVTIIVDDTYFYGDVNKYMFPSLDRKLVLRSDTNEITFTTDRSWDIRDLILIDGINEVRIKRHEIN